MGGTGESAGARRKTCWEFPNAPEGLRKPTSLDRNAVGQIEVPAFRLVEVRPNEGVESRIRVSWTNVDIGPVVLDCQDAAHETEVFGRLPARNDVGAGGGVIIGAVHRPEGDAELIAYLEIVIQTDPEAIQLVAPEHQSGRTGTRSQIERLTRVSVRKRLIGQAHLPGVNGEIPARVADARGIPGRILFGAETNCHGVKIDSCPGNLGYENHQDHTHQHNREPKHLTPPSAQIGHI